MNPRLNFQLLRPFLLQGNFWQIKFLLTNVNKYCQDFTLWMLFYRSNTGFGNISLPLLWDLKQHVQFGVLCLLFPVTISIDQRENLPTALGLVLFKRKNLWTLFAICHLDRSLLTEKNSCWLKCLMLRPNKIREGNISLHIPEQFMVYDNHWITSIKSVFSC